MQLKISSQWLIWNILDSWRTWGHLPVAMTLLFCISLVLPYSFALSVCVSKLWLEFQLPTLDISLRSVKVDAIPENFQLMLSIRLLFQSFLFLFGSGLYTHILCHGTLQCLTSRHRMLSHWHWAWSSDLPWLIECEHYEAKPRPGELRRVQPHPAKSSQAWWSTAKLNSSSPVS